MKTRALLTILAFAVMLTAGSQLKATVIAGAGGTYTTPFSPTDTLTYDASFPGVLGTQLNLDSTGFTTDTSGIWSNRAQGGSAVTVLGIHVERSGAQVALTGTSLQFNRDTAPTSSILGLLGTGTNLSYNWNAQASFSGFTYQANSEYTLNFHVDGNNGLLQTIAGLTPSFGVEFVDGAGNPLAVKGGGTLIDLIGLLGTGVTSGDVTLQLDTGAVAPTGTVAVKFVGNAEVSAAAVGIGTNFATVTNLGVNVSPVPEPTGALLVGVCGMCVMFRRRRLERLR